MIGEEGHAVPDKPATAGTRIAAVLDALDRLPTVATSDARYELEGLLECRDALLRRSPIQPGDWVRLTRAIDFDRAPGWRPFADRLVVGATGLAVDLAYRHGVYRVTVVWDWDDSPPERRAHFMIDADRLEAQAQSAESRSTGSVAEGPSPKTVRDPSKEDERARRPGRECACGPMTTSMECPWHN